MDNMDMDILRKRINQRCKDLHMTHTDLATKSDVSINTINSWFRKDEKNAYGKTKNNTPHIDKLYRVAVALDTSLDYLVGRVDFLHAGSADMSDFTGLSDNAIECLHGWHTDQLQVGMFSSYYKDIDTLNTILEYYNQKRKANRRKGLSFNNVYTLFHYIGSFLHASKFQRVQQDMIRYGSGTHFDTIEKGDTITKKSTGKSEKIDMLCTPISSSSHRGDDITKVDIVNTEDTSEQYYLEISDLYREHAKSQIIDTLKMIGGIE